MKFIETIMNKKNEKKRDKEFLKKLEQEEKEIEKEVGETKEKFGFQNIINILEEDKDEEREFEASLTESEREEMEERKKDERKIYVTAGIVFSLTFIFIIIGAIVLGDATKSDLIKYTQPLIEEYYKEKYNNTLTITEIKTLIYLNEKKQEEESNIQIATTKDENHIVAINNELLGDDIDNTKVYNEYNNYITSLNPKVNIITTHPIISYKDYYKNYNLLESHIKALPNNMDFNALLNSNKMTLTDTILYQGNIDFNPYLTFINKLTTDSKLFMIKTEIGIPTNLTIITKNNIWSIDIKDTKEIEKDITYYNLDIEKNNVTDLTIQHVKENSIETTGEYKLKNTYSIKFDTRGSYDEGTKKSSYFMIKIDDTIFEDENIILFEPNYYRKMETYEYPYMVFAKSGNSIYIIGTEPIGISNKNTKNNILCYLGLC